MNGAKKQKINPVRKFSNGISNKPIILSVTLAILLVLVFSHKMPVAGQTANELRQQRADKQKQLNDILSKINSYQQEIKQKQAAVNTLKNQMDILNLQIAQTQAQIDATQRKIDVTNLEIADVTEQIIQTQKDIDKEKDHLRTLIGEINDLDQRTPLEIALENDNFTAFLNDLQYATSIQEQSQQSLTKIKKLKADLDQHQSELKKQKSDLDTFENQLNVTRTSLTGQQKTKQQVLDQTRGQETQYQKLLSLSEQERKQLNDEINNLDNQIAAKLGNRRLRAIHGLLAWPMDGTLTQGYGNTGFTSLGYNFHNGIDIAAPAGTPIYASGDGAVVATGTGNGAYGDWVAIKHSSGKFAAHPIVTLYGHMSSFRVRTGQQVKLGDLVGFEGNSGNTTRLLFGPDRGYHVHFTVFDEEGFGVAPGAYAKIFGPYDVPYGATYNPLDFL